jgi:hypothetical protein
MRTGHVTLHWAIMCQRRQHSICSGSASIPYPIATILSTVYSASWSRIQAFEEALLVLARHHSFALLTGAAAMHLSWLVLRFWCALACLAHPPVTFPCIVTSLLVPLTSTSTTQQPIPTWSPYNVSTLFIEQQSLLHPSVCNV